MAWVAEWWGDKSCVANPKSLAGNLSSSIDPDCQCSVLMIIMSQIFIPHNGADFYTVNNHVWIDEEFFLLIMYTSVVQPAALLFIFLALALLTG
jgi:hypothetical protein